MNMDDRWHLSASVLMMLLALPMPSIAYGCGRTEFSELNGSISSVNYPSQYYSNIYCIYSIRSPGLYQSVFIKFTDFDTEQSHDRVEIWCSTSVSSKRTFSGRYTNLSFFQLKPCNSVKVSFRTDSSVVGRGFRLVFHWLISGCGRTEFSEQSGYVSSPNYPFDYSDNVNCTYSIRSPGLHQSVFIGFTDFDTDTVQIWCSTNVTRIFSFSGRNASPSYFALQPCKDVKISFRTDNITHGRGFKLFFYWTFSTTISSPTTEPTSMSSLHTETEGLHDTSDNILAALGARTLSLLVLVLASLLVVGVFVIILVSIIFATRRLKRRKNATKTRLEVRGAVDNRGCSNDGYSLEPISTCRRPVSVEYEIEEADYEQMDPPNDNDEDDDEYQNFDGIVR